MPRRQKHRVRVKNQFNDMPMAASTNRNEQPRIAEIESRFLFLAFFFGSTTLYSFCCRAFIIRARVCLHDAGCIWMRLVFVASLFVNSHARSNLIFASIPNAQIDLSQPEKREEKNHFTLKFKAARNNARKWCELRW